MKLKPVFLTAAYALCVSSVWAEESINAGKNDNEVGSATRAMLGEQREGINRGDIEPYKAESAGKAYRAYTDSIGKPAEQVKSQLDSVK